MQEGGQDAEGTEMQVSMAMTALRATSRYHAASCDAGVHNTDTHLNVGWHQICTVTCICIRMCIVVCSVLWYGRVERTPSHPSHARCWLSIPLVWPDGRVQRM